MEEAEYFIRDINQCLLPKLARNYDEIESHAEYHIRNNNMDENMKKVFGTLKRIDVKKSPVDDTAEAMKADRISIISSLFILYKELLCNCSWNTHKCKEYALTLNEKFETKCEIQLEDVIKRNDMCDYQEIFDKILDGLCQKLTLENFKKYPGQVEVYCAVTQKLKDLGVNVKPPKMFPIALILIDDYIESNKIKGLQCCYNLLKYFTAKDFVHGNYYDVIYLSIKNTLSHKNLKITEIGQACCLQLCEIFPSDVKDVNLDEMYTAALEQLHVESDLYRKAMLFKYAAVIIKTLQIKCVGKSLFKTVMYDSIESCLIDSVAAILLIPSLQCLEQWITYCWPVWKLSVDFKILCALLKYYSKCNTGEGGLLVQKLIVTLVSLCTQQEQKEFVTKLADYKEEEQDEDSSESMDDQEAPEDLTVAADTTGIEYIEDLTEGEDTTN